MTDSLEGTTLPQITLEATGLNPKSNEVGRFEIPIGFQGAWSVLYFYPKDDTPGCTRQACGYRDQTLPEGVRLFGVSADSIESHFQFEEKFQLNFPLLSDSEKRLADALGVLDAQTGDLSRDSFLIDPQGRVVRVWRNVHPVDSVEATLAEARERAQATGQAG